MSREYKHYELRATNRPSGNSRLSTTVAVIGVNGHPYYCYVTFSEKLVVTVGKKLPRGISPFDPAYLFVDCSKGQYEVWAKYVRDDVGAILWSGSLEDPPTWLNFFKVKNNGDSSKNG
jgi:hypothetical protein